MAVRRRWRLWKRPGQRAEEKGIGTNPSGVKHRSSYIPVPFLLSLSLSLFHHFLTQPPTYSRLAASSSAVSPSFPPLLVYHRVSTFLSKSSHVPYVSLTVAKALSACFLPPSTLTVILFPSFCPPIYLSIRISSSLRPFPSYLFVYRSIPDFSLAVHFRPFFSPSPFPPSFSDFLCKRPQVDLWHYCLLPRYFLSDWFHQSSAPSTSTSSFISHYLYRAISPPVPHRHH